MRDPTAETEYLVESELDVGFAVVGDFGEVVGLAPFEGFGVEVDADGAAFFAELDPFAADGEGSAEVFAECDGGFAVAVLVDFVEELDLVFGFLDGELVEDVFVGDVGHGGAAGQAGGGFGFFGFGHGQERIASGVWRLAFRG